MDKIKLKALGKINLGLDVLGRRPNGYHDVRMVMQTVYLYDQILLEKTDKEGISLKTNLFYLPVNENNLAYRAAKMLIDEFAIKEGVHISLEKHIPVAAGMAGGSSNAAAVLYGMNRLFQAKMLIDEFAIKEGVHISLEKHIPVAAGMAGGSSNAAAVLYGMNRLFHLGLTDQELMERGVKLGADVPYCIMRGTVLAEGIGEELTPLPAMPKCHVLLAKPPISVSTQKVYEKLDAQEVTKHPDIDGILLGLQTGDLKKITSSMGNVLENVTITEYPQIERIKDVMKEEGALNAMMSGSGPTVFGIYDDKMLARRAAARIREEQLAKQVHVTTMHNVRRKS